MPSKSNYKVKFSESQKAVTLKEINGFPGYKISSDGKVYSYMYKTYKWKYDYDKDPIEVKQQTNKQGYRTVMLRGKPLRINRVVCLHFNGEPEIKLEASHINGNKLDNRAENLCWETHLENNRRKILHGTTNKGIKLKRRK
jgi:hypothetical protein